MAVSISPGGHSGIDQYTTRTETERVRRELADRAEFRSTVDTRRSGVLD